MREPSTEDVSGGYELATSLSLEFGDLKLLPGQLPPGEQAAAIPPGTSAVSTQKQYGVLALSIGFVVVYVSARCRKRRRNPSRRRASIPGLVAVLETCLTTIVAIVGDFLKRG
jgi:hypothetical protein